MSSKKIKPRKRDRRHAVWWLKRLEQAKQVQTAEALEKFLSDSRTFDVFFELTKSELGAKKALKGDIQRVFFAATWLGLVVEPDRVGPASKMMRARISKGVDAYEAAVEVYLSTLDVVE